MHRRGSCQSSAIYRPRCSSRRLTSASKAREGCSSSCPTLTPSEQPTLVPLVQRALSIRPQAVIPRGNRVRCSCAAGCAVASPRRCSTPFRSPLTMTRPWAARATCVAGSQTAAPSGGQGPNAGQGSGQRLGLGGSTTSTTTQSAATTPAIAQNWLNLHAERSLSSFDQRHLLNLQAQYTSGEGLGGGTLMSGWPGRLLKEWTVVATSVVGTGLPETPVYLAAVPGTGYTGTIRPNPTGAPISMSRGSQHLNPAAYTAPLPGQWGTAGRNSITGPSQFSLDSSVARTFRPSGRFYLDLKVAATNMLNHPVFTGWNTTVNSTQFGLPLNPNSMRSLETSLRLRF